MIRLFVLGRASLNQAVAGTGPFLVPGALNSLPMVSVSQRLVA